jgi:RNA polymerase sigma factor (sigma-70 family)
VNRALLQSVLRIVEVEESTNDSMLLDAYRNSRNDAAFGQLVKRYARLVWHVCRNLTRCDADAEDAFQATFLVLARNAGKIAKPERLGSWLHGVACRVCSKARREAGRRNKRERAVANGEASNNVTDSKWDQALAAVHEELAGMPEIYRLPFVLCCLEGKGTTEAANQLGWKLGTLSGRLTRAKDLLIARLESRGIAIGAVAAAAFTVGTTNAPASIVGNAASIASGTTIPGSILYLSQGVIGMNFHRIKLLAAAIMLTGGLGIGLGTTWLANAQDPAKPKTPEVDGKLNINSLTAIVDVPASTDSKPVKKWEYYYNPKHDGRANGIKPSEFEQLLADMEPYGWEFVGEVNMRVATPAGGDPSGTGGVTLPIYVFRRPVKTDQELLDMLKEDREGKANPTKNQIKQVIQPSNSPLNQMAQKMLDQQIADAEALRIRNLEVELAQLKSKRAKQVDVVYKQANLPLDASEIQDILQRIAPKIGIKNLRVVANQSDGGSLTLVGDAESIEWAKRLIQTLSGTTDPVKPVKP